MGSGVFTTKDGTSIFYKDWGSGRPIAFHHGWPLSADDWDNQMLFFLALGYRVIAHDRRGHGRSSQTDLGNDMDTYAADCHELFAHLGLTNAIHVGHSTGGGEVARYVARYGGDGRVAKAVLISAIPPLMLKTDANPGGCRSRSSTSSAPVWPTARSSISMWRRAPSTASTGRARRSSRGSSATGGARA